MRSYLRRVHAFDIFLSKLAPHLYGSHSSHRRNGRKPRLTYLNSKSLSLPGSFQPRHSSVINNTMPRILLIFALPKSGFIWECRDSLVRRPSSDAKIQIALRKTAGVRMATAEVVPLFISALERAAKKVATYQVVGRDFVSLYDAIEQSQELIPWARELSATIFADLLIELKEARLR